MRRASSARTARPLSTRSLALAGPDQAGEALGAATAGDDAEQDLGLAEAGVVAGDAQVAGQRQLAAAAEGGPRDGGDDHARDGGDGVERLEEQRADLAALLGAAELGDVGAGREDPLAAGHDDGARRIGGEVLGRRPQLPEQLGRQRVHLAVLEPDEGHAVVATLDCHEGFGHGPDPTGGPGPGSGAGQAATGGTSEVQNAHRVAALGIELRQSGHGRSSLSSSSRPLRRRSRR